MFRKWLVEVEVVSWVEIHCWKYCTPMEGNKNGKVCNYCGLTINSSEITRFTFYLSHIDPHSNTKRVS